MKKNIKRFIATVFTVMTITIMASFTMTSASAAVVEPTATTVSVTMSSRMNSLSIPLPSFPNLKMDEVAVPEQPAGSSYDAEQGFSSIVDFFVTWIQKVGGLVALVGGIMFCLAIKNNDAEQKQSGLLTLVAGFAVIAICGAISYFGL